MSSNKKVILSSISFELSHKTKKKSSSKGIKIYYNVPNKHTIKIIHFHLQMQTLFLGWLFLKMSSSKKVILSSISIKLSDKTKKKSSSKGINSVPNSLNKQTNKNLHFCLQMHCEYLQPIYSHWLCYINHCNQAVIVTANNSTHDIQ